MADRPEPRAQSTAPRCPACAHPLTAAYDDGEGFWECDGCGHDFEDHEVRTPTNTDPTPTGPNPTRSPTMVQQHTEHDWPRWATEAGISDLSVAVDEIYFLRAVLADEAAIIEAHLGYATFPKSRRVVAEDQVQRLRQIANGQMWAATREKFDQQRALRSAEAPVTLTNATWAEQRHLRQVTPPESATS